MERPLFQLGGRLATCARLVRSGRPMADIGTDHAYLPIWLIKNSIVPRAVAADIRSGPLAAARKNAEKYGVTEQLALVLSDGLEALSPQDADDVVIAGMGGELMLRMVKETEWLKNPEKRLILQPMSSVPELREGLAESGVSVQEEIAAEDGGKVYSAFSVQYISTKPETDTFYPYLGKLAPGTAAVRLYAEKVVRELKNRAVGAACEGREREAEKLRELVRAVEIQFIGEKGET